MATIFELLSEEHSLRLSSPPFSYYSAYFKYGFFRKGGFLLDPKKASRHGLHEAPMNSVYPAASEFRDNFRDSPRLPCFIEVTIEGKQVIFFLGYSLAQPYDKNYEIRRTGELSTDDIDELETKRKLCEERHGGSDRSGRGR